MKRNIRKSVVGASLAGLLVLPSVRASDSFGSEFSHFAGGGAAASAIAIIVYEKLPDVKHPAMTGFIVSSAGTILGEVIQAATDGKFSPIDAVSGTAGAAVGAFLTDKWYIAPKIETQKGETTYGVVATHRF